MGMLWQDCSEKSIARPSCSEKDEEVLGWEWFFVHRPQKSFLSIYVDDFKMSGATSAVDKMWITVGKK